jgi:hypothetical protein
MPEVMANMLDDKDIAIPTVTAIRRKYRLNRLVDRQRRMMLKENNTISISKGTERQSRKGMNRNCGRRQWNSRGMRASSNKHVDVNKAIQILRNICQDGFWTPATIQ